jgi:hypothetical protein
MESPERRIIYNAKPIDGEDKKFSGELKKSKEDEEMIALAADLLGEYLHDNGVDDADITCEERVHLFYERQYTKLAKDNRECVGNHDPETSRIQAIKKQDRLFTMFTVVHEMVHEAGVRKWSFVVSKKGKDDVYRTGYQVADSRGKTKDDAHFTAFDEGVVETTALGALSYGKERTAKQFGIPLEVFDQELTRSITYHDAVSVVMLINTRIARFLEKDEKEVWAKIVQGEVNGKMMWMRDIENTFGSGSLRVLDRLVAYPKKETEKVLNEKIIRYFSLEDIEDRIGLQAEIY